MTDPHLTEEEMEELHYLLIHSKMKQNFNEIESEKEKTLSLPKKKKS